MSNLQEGIAESEHRVLMEDNRRSQKQQVSKLLQFRQLWTFGHALWLRGKQENV